MEQQERNVLLRPRLRYVGERDRVFVPIDERAWRRKGTIRQG